MINSTLLVTLRLFSPEEREMLPHFVVSPLFKLNNRHQDAVDLFNYLKIFAPVYNDTQGLQRAVVADALFAKRSNPENELRKAMSGLQNILKKIILVQSILMQGKQASDDSPEELIQATRTELALLRFLSDRKPTAEKKYHRGGGKRIRQNRILLNSFSMVLKIKQANLYSLIQATNSWQGQILSNSVKCCYLIY